LAGKGRAEASRRRSEARKKGGYASRVIVSMVGGVVFGGGRSFGGVF